MAWVYAELAKEAANRGGPVALRYFYRGQGFILGGVLASAAIAGTVAHDKWSKRRAADEAALESATETPTPGGAPETVHS
ncbi:hypothetical protein OG890_22200 [Streptomyces anulatus]|uniref:hypothetical protein n=1 Tax=Streptomyces anulatus TaxID=1892 RepID=UPI00224CBE8F|nr:hypothetical protein [Streptomyces anulatus]MCX4486613.1 hypothetical protein [Streptomyces anulatus]WSI82247.1 hypothetical protein OG557_37275 [Streptomyces anulatus]WSU78206.1 hypothetical protein OG499_36980 [Streptomyces anulatus]